MFRHCQRRRVQDEHLDHREMRTVGLSFPHVKSEIVEVLLKQKTSEGNGGSTEKYVTHLTTRYTQRHRVEESVGYSVACVRSRQAADHQVLSMPRHPSEPALAPFPRHHLEREMAEALVLSILPWLPAHSRVKDDYD